MSKKNTRVFDAADGVRWTVEVRTPGSSNVMIVFHHPDGSTGRRNRYAWHVWSGAEARDVTARLTPREVLDEVDDADLARLFRRSMAINAVVPSSAPVRGGGTA